MADQSDLEKLYREAQSALKAKDYALASELLRQILKADVDYKDAAQLLARVIKLSRRRWYNDPRLWGTLGVLLMVGLGIWLSRFLPQQTATIPVESTIAPPVTVISATATMTRAPAATPIPLTWKRVSMGQEFPRDTITSIVVDPKDPDVIYIGMKNAGVFKSIDGGNSWYPAQNGLGNAQVLSLVVHPQNANTLLTGTQGGVFLTTDGGESWQIVSEITGKFLLVDPQNGSHIYLGDGKNIYESNDLGASWITNTDDASCPSKTQYNTLVMDPQNSKTIFATAAGANEGMGGCQGVYRSNDNGHTWARLGLISAGEMAFLQDNDGKTAYLTAGNDNTRQGKPEGQRGGLIISNNAGKDWRWEQTYYCTVMATNHHNPALGYCGVEKGGLFVISARGGVLQSGIVTEHVTAIYADNYNGQQRIIAGVEKNGLFISLDGGKTWGPKIGGIGTLYLGLKHELGNRTRMYANIKYSNTSCVLFRSDDSGRNWKIILDIQPASDERRISNCNPAIDADNNIYTIQNLTLMQSKDGGDSWDFLPMPQLTDTINVRRWVSANPIISGLLYFLPTIEPCLYYSTDSGQSWQKSNSAFCHYDDDSNATLFFGNQGQIVYRERQRSSDAGKTWQDCGEGSGRNRYSDSFLAVDPQNSKHIILATTGQGIKVSSDSCQSMQPSNVGLDNLFVNTVAFAPDQPNIVYAGTDGGAYISYDAGATWKQVNDGLLGATVVYSIAVDPEGNVYAATPYGIFKLEEK